MQNDLSALAEEYIDFLSGTPDHALDGIAHAFPPRTPELRAGQIWRVKSTNSEDRSALVAITHVDDAVIRAVLVSSLMWLATEEDVLVPSLDEDDHPRLLCLWRDIPISREVLDTWVCDVPPLIMQAVRRYLRRRISGGYSLRVDSVVAFPELGAGVRWRIAPLDKSEPALDLITGPKPLNPEDPRFAVHNALCAATAWIPEAAVNAIDD